MPTCRMLLLNTSMSPAFLSGYRYVWLGQDESFNSNLKHASQNLCVIQTTDAALCALQHKRTSLLSMQSRVGCSLLPDPSSRASARQPPATCSAVKT